PEGGSAVLIYPSSHLNSIHPEMDLRSTTTLTVMKEGYIQ
ncbi:uncharacterized, partial [Tachysurus ichikawai]